MSAVRVRTPGNVPCTRICCDRRFGEYCPTYPPEGYDAREARQAAKANGWIRVNGKDYCPVHSAVGADALPDHADWDGPCGHRKAWDAVTTHTRTVNGIGPDHCAECSDAIREWVEWPCRRGGRRAE